MASFDPDLLVCPSPLCRIWRSEGDDLKAPPLPEKVRMAWEGVVRIVSFSVGETKAKRCYFNRRVGAKLEYYDDSWAASTLRQATAAPRLGNSHATWMGAPTPRGAFINKLEHHNE